MNKKLKIAAISVVGAVAIGFRAKMEQSIILQQFENIKEVKDTIPQMSDSIRADSISRAYFEGAQLAKDSVARMGKTIKIR